MSANIRRTFSGEEDWLNMKGRYHVSAYYTYPNGWDYVVRVYDVEIDRLYSSLSNSVYINFINDTHQGFSVTRDYVNDIIYIHHGNTSDSKVIKFQNGVFEYIDESGNYYIYGCTYNGNIFYVKSDGYLYDSKGNKYNSGSSINQCKVIGNTVYLNWNTSGDTPAIYDLSNGITFLGKSTGSSSYGIGEAPIHHFV